MTDIPTKDSIDDGSIKQTEMSHTQVSAAAMVEAECAALLTEDGQSDIEKILKELLSAEKALIEIEQKADMLNNTLDTLLRNHVDVEKTEKC